MKPFFANGKIHRSALDTMSYSNHALFFIHGFIIKGDSMIMQKGDSLFIKKKPWHL